VQEQIKFQSIDNTHVVKALKNNHGLYELAISNLDLEKSHKILSVFISCSYILALPMSSILLFECSYLS
jgi:hypothetical protein